LVRKRRKPPRIISIDFSQETDPVTELKRSDLNPNAIFVSQSSINTWRKCKKQYHYKFIEKLEKKAAPVSLYKGKIIHELIEARINGKDWRPVLKEHLEEFDKMFDEEKIMYGDLPTDLPAIMEGYERMYEDEDLTYLELHGKKAEFDFFVPLDDKPIEESELVFTGKIDTVARDSNNRVWLMDHKTFKKLPSENFRFVNQQSLLYSWAMPFMGLPEPDGMIWDYIRTKLPTKPQILARGGISKAKSIDTTYDTYLGVIIENNLDPEDYRDILNNLQGAELNFYRRIYLPTKKNMIDSVVRDLKETALEIKALQEITQARNLSKDCDFCSFKTLCQTELQGFDSDFVRKNEYRPSTYHLVKEEEHGEENDD
jgi:hypothetical protein